MNPATGKPLTEREELAQLRTATRITEHREDLHHLIKNILKSSRETGLKEDQAQENQALYGFNEIPGLEPDSVMEIFLGEFFSYYACLIWLTMALNVIAFMLTMSLEQIYIAILLLAVNLFNAISQTIQNIRSDDISFFPEAVLEGKVKVFRRGRMLSLDSKLVTKGDIIFLETNSYVPADIRIIECSPNLRVDCSNITGETEPNRKRVECTDENPLETANLCFFGTKIVEGDCLGICINVGAHSFLGKTTKLAMNLEDLFPPLLYEMQNFVRAVCTIGLTISLLVYFVGAMILRREWSEVMTFLVGIMVANVPEGVLTYLTTMLLIFKAKLADSLAVKHLECIETLGSMSCLAMDKTGTLTFNRITLVGALYAESEEKGFEYKAAGSTFTRGEFSINLGSRAWKELLRAGVLCNSSEFSEDSKWRLAEDGLGKEPIPHSTENNYDGFITKEYHWRTTSDPCDGAVITFKQDHDDVKEYRKKNIELYRIPYHFQKKYGVVVCCQEQFQVEGTVEASFNPGPRVVLMAGNPETVLARCSSVKLGKQEVKMDGRIYKELLQHLQKLNDQGVRIIAYAQRLLPFDDYGLNYVYDDGKAIGYSSPNFPIGEFRSADAKTKVHPNAREGMTFLGYLTFIDPPRPQIPSAIAKLKVAGIKIVLMTGDQVKTAMAIAYSTGILWSRTAEQIMEENTRLGLKRGDMRWEDPKTADAIIVTGSEFETGKDWRWWDFVLGHDQVVFARVSPQQKIFIVEQLQKLGHIVVVVGEGVCDAPPLKRADAALAMIGGHPVSRKVSDIMLCDNNFANLVHGVYEGRLLFDNMKKLLAYGLSSNVPEMLPFILYFLLQIPLPLTAILCLVIDLGTDMLPSLAFAYEGEEDNIMTRRPRNVHQSRLVSSKLIFHSYFQLGLLQAAAGILAYIVVLNDYGFPPSILVGLGANNYWGRYPIFCKFAGGQYVDLYGNIDPAGYDPSITAPTVSYPFWDTGDGGYIQECVYPVRTFSGGDGLSTTFEITDASTYDMRVTGGKPQITVETISALEQNGFYEYIPWRGRMSPFWDTRWLYWDISESDTGYDANLVSPPGILGPDVNLYEYFSAQPAGLWSICSVDPIMTHTDEVSDMDSADRYNEIIDGTNFTLYDNGETNPYNAPFSCAASATFTYGLRYNQGLFCNNQIFTADDDLPLAEACAPFANNTHNVFWCAADKCSSNCTIYTGGDSPSVGCLNIASRKIQEEALAHAQTGYFVAVVVVQWANLMACKSRWLSVRQCGLQNSVTNIAFIMSVLIAAWVCYAPPLQRLFGARPLRLVHWMIGFPFGMILFIFDESRKFLIRNTSPEYIDKSSGQIKRHMGWFERNTYY